MIQRPYPATLQPQSPKAGSAQARGTSQSSPTAVRSPGWHQKPIAGAVATTPTAGSSARRLSATATAPSYSPVHMRSPVGSPSAAFFGQRSTMQQRRPSLASSSPQASSSPVAGRQTLSGSYVALPVPKLEGTASEGGLSQAWRSSTGPGVVVDNLSRSLIECPTYEADYAQVTTKPAVKQPVPVPVESVGAAPSDSVNHGNYTELKITSDPSDGASVPLANGGTAAYQAAAAALSTLNTDRRPVSGTQQRPALQVHSLSGPTSLAPAPLQRKPPPPAQAQAATGAIWNVLQTLKLGSGVIGQLTVDILVSRSKIRLFDAKSMNSVNAAVAQLNQGTLMCPDGCCIVFSNSSNCFYVLYSLDQQRKVEELVNKASEDAQAQAASGISMGGPSVATAVSSPTLSMAAPAAQSSPTAARPPHPVAKSPPPPDPPKLSSMASIETQPPRPSIGGQESEDAQEEMQSPLHSPTQSPVARRAVQRSQSSASAVQQGATNAQLRTVEQGGHTQLRTIAQITGSPANGVRQRAPAMMAPTSAAQRYRTSPTRSAGPPATPSTPQTTNQRRPLSPPPPRVIPSTSQAGSTSVTAPAWCASGTPVNSGPANRRTLTDKDRPSPINIFTPRTRSKGASSLQSQSKQTKVSSTGGAQQSSPVVGLPSSATAPESTSVASTVTEAPGSFSESASSREFAASEKRQPELDIGGRGFRFEKIIGRGAFGVVHLARDSTGGEAAVKVIHAKDAQAFATAAFEAELLQILSVALQSAHKLGWRHVPQYISHSATRSQNGAGGGTVKLAMSFCPGGALDRWLYGISDEEHKTVDVAELIDGKIPGGQQGCWYMHDAANVVRDLMTQLASVFVALEQIAYHRDVSSHNVLLDFPDGEGPGSKPRFALIDFGLAVRSGSWDRDWRTSNLAGDPRYWTPSAWMAFAFGFKYVATHPNAGFQSQYLYRMDHFSLGVLALETLFALWNTGEAHEGKGNTPGFLEVRAAWFKYWAAVIHLFQMFHRHGAAEVRQYLAQSQDEGVNGLCVHLRQLRVALRTAAMHSKNSAYSSVLMVCADLLDERGTSRWTDIPTMLSPEHAASKVPCSTPPTAPVQHTRIGVADVICVARSSMDLADPLSASMPNPVHRRIRSTGGVVDQERRRVEPEVTQPRAPSTQAWSKSPITSAAGAGHTVDPLSRTFSHARHVSGYI